MEALAAYKTIGPNGVRGPYIQRCYVGIYLEAFLPSDVQERLDLFGKLPILCAHPQWLCFPPRPNTSKRLQDKGVALENYCFKVRGTLEAPG